MSKPTLPTPEAIRGAGAARPLDPALGDAKWWEVFQDEQLQALVRTALDAERRRAALPRRACSEAEAQLGITRADQYPSVGAEVQGGGGRTAAQSDRRRRATRRRLRIEGSTVDWELDFWGRFRRATESARAQLLATEWGRRAVLTTVVSQVAEAYFELARARPSARDRAADADVTSGVAAADASARERRRHVAGRRARGRAARVRRRRGHRRHRAPHRAAGELHQHSARATFPSPITRGRELVDQPHSPDVPAGLPSARSWSGGRTSRPPSSRSSPPTRRSAWPVRRISRRSR